MKCTKMRRAVAISTALVLSAGLPAALHASGEVVGQITSIGTSLDGVKVPSGTTMLSPALVATSEQPAILHLAGGRVVNLAPETTAHVEATDTGLVGLSVDEGSAAYVGDDGEVVRIADMGRVMFAPMIAQQGQIGEGEANEVKMCELRDSNPAKFTLCTVDQPSDNSCRWRKLVVPPAEVGNYLDINAVLAGDQEWNGRQGNEIGLDENCKTTPLGAADGERVGVAVAPLTGVASAAVIVGGVLAGSAIYDGIDHEEEISPVTP